MVRSVERQENTFKMNTAVALLVVVVLENSQGIVIKDHEEKDQKQARSQVTYFPHRRESQQITAHDHHQNSSDRNSRSGKTKGGKSQSHQETGKRGEDFKENIKKEYGSYKRAKGDDVTGSRAEGNSEKTSDKKHFSHRKAGANKKKKNISKGFHEEYRKDEKKSKHGHWEHEHTEGKFIKFGKKRGQKGAKKADQSDKKKARNINGGIANDFKGMDQLVSVVWSNKK